MSSSDRTALIEYLKDFITEARWEKMNEVLAQRTRHLTVVVEDIYQSHNASAVLRSCDGFGIQDAHIIENQNTFDASSQVTIGADQWLSLHRYNAEGTDNTEACIQNLKESGYQVIATTPHEDDYNLNDLPIQQKTALVFGTELDGISERAKELADGFVKIPMFGFSESFNISVSAAVCLYNLTRRMRKSDAIDWHLSEEEKDELRLEWLKQSIKAGEQLEKTFLEKNS
ncbi:TrmH family RNA methyltransferase [Gracilimonas mengyeensis]|uniref:tRNA (guanosine(18)-2'-O)-methyltransferase n=1 Tax=Gracilimonas mengyeensis TaxID=1302730 RepID=A0A521AWZ5_9BACT|nr:RNA methyltransferase [Gracilimonas mengyeensis]SMO39368.1 tRNA (guanosine-2'-O-)-methyltransferase [Gracilimonas mengyeensis]